MVIMQEEEEEVVVKARIVELIVSDRLFQVIFKYFALFCC